MSVKSLFFLWKSLAQNNNTHSLSIERALRSSNDPLFFTVNMPLLGKDVDRSLTSGRLTVTSPFKLKKGTALPLFLNEHFLLIYYKDGTIRYDVEHRIRVLRQLLFMFYKLSVPLKDDMILTSYDNFIKRDRLVKTSDWPELSELRKNFLSLLPSNVLDILPKHSNGATQSGITNYDKFKVRRYIPSLMKFYSPRFFFHNYTHASEYFKDNLIVDEPASRVTLVPKDSRGPRTICIEPHEKMFIQQGLMHLLYDFLELDPPTKGRVNFTDQTINQRLAYKASIDQSYCTIDLKDASDMVSFDLIRRLVSPEWFLALRASRTEYADVNGDLIKLNKFAPMGSALCFPIEAMLFFSICRLITSDVYVYGDDIIVPNRYAGDVISKLEAYGLIVNRDKTLFTGYFRESCGAEFYNGHDISVLKLKSLDYLSVVDFANNIDEILSECSSDAFIHAYESLNDTIVYRECLENTVRSPGVFYTRYTASSSVFFRSRYNRDLQRYEVRRLVPTIKDKLKLDGYDGLFAWLTDSEKSSTPSDTAYIKRLAIRQDLNLDRRLTVSDSSRSFSNAVMRWKWVPCQR